MSTESGEARFPVEDPLALLDQIIVKLYSIWVSVTYPFAAVGKKLSIHPTCRMSRTRASQISLGHKVTIHKDVWLNTVTGSPNEVKLVIEDNVCIGVRSTVSAKNMIHLGKSVLTGPSVLIQDHQHAFEDIRIPIVEQGVTSGGRIWIEEGCWIGQGAVIVCNSGDLVIGRNSVIGANSVVTKSFPPYSVIVGSPGTLLKQFDPVSGKWLRAGEDRSKTASAVPSLSK